MNLCIGTCMFTIKKKSLRRIHGCYRLDFLVFGKEQILVGYGWGLRGDYSQSERHAINRQLYPLNTMPGTWRKDDAANPEEWISIPGGILTLELG